MNTRCNVLSSNELNITYALRQRAARGVATVLVVGLAILIALGSAVPSALAAPHQRSVGDGISRAYAIIVNGDDSPHHRGNVKLAVETLHKLGVEADRLFVLSAGSEPSSDAPSAMRSGVSRSELRRVVRQLAAVVDGDDSVIVYTTGHGAWARGAARLLLGRTIVSAKEMARWLDSIPWKRLIFIGDQCYSGAFAGALQGSDREVIAIASTDAAHEVHCTQFVHPFWRALRRQSTTADALPLTTWREAFTAGVLSQRSSEPHEEHYPQFLTTGINPSSTLAMVASK